MISNPEKKKQNYVFLIQKGEKDSECVSVNDGHRHRQAGMHFTLNKFASLNKQWSSYTLHVNYIHIK